MKNILAENMRRFGTKNLNEQLSTDPTSDCTMKSVSIAISNNKKSIPGFKYHSAHPNGPEYGVSLLGTGFAAGEEQQFKLILFDKERKWVLQEAEVNTAGNKTYVNIGQGVYWTGTWGCTDKYTGGIALYSKKSVDWTLYIKDKFKLKTNTDTDTDTNTACSLGAVSRALKSGANFIPGFTFYKFTEGDADIYGATLKATGKTAGETDVEYTLQITKDPAGNNVWRLSDNLWKTLGPDNDYREKNRNPIEGNWRCIEGLGTKDTVLRLYDKDTGEDITLALQDVLGLYK